MVTNQKAKRKEVMKRRTALDPKPASTSAEQKLMDLLDSIRPIMFKLRKDLSREQFDKTFQELMATTSKLLRMGLVRGAENASLPPH